MTKFCTGQAKNAIKIKVRWSKITQNLCYEVMVFEHCSPQYFTIMHIKFEHVQAVDDKVIFQTSRKCYKNFNQRKITHRHYEVQLWFFHTALCIIATITNAKFQVNQTGDDKLMLRTKNYHNKLSNSRTNNSTYSGPITPLIKLI